MQLKGIAGGGASRRSRLWRGAPASVVCTIRAVSVDQRTPRWPSSSLIAHVTACGDITNLQSRRQRHAKPPPLRSQWFRRSLSNYSFGRNGVLYFSEILKASSFKHSALVRRLRCEPKLAHLSFPEQENQHVANQHLIRRAVPRNFKTPVCRHAEAIGRGPQRGRICESPLNSAGRLPPRTPQLGRKRDRRWSPWPAGRADLCRAERGEGCFRCYDRVIRRHQDRRTQHRLP